VTPYDTIGPVATNIPTRFISRHSQQQNLEDQMAQTELLNYMCALKPSLATNSSKPALIQKDDNTSAVEMLETVKEENRRLKRTLAERFKQWVMTLIN